MSVAGWLAEHAPAGAPVGVAVAGTFGRGTGALTGVALAAAGGAGAPGSTRPSWTRPTTPALAAWLADPDRPKVLHDAKPARCWRSPPAAGRWPGVASDTALAAYLALPGPALATT